MTKVIPPDGIEMLPLTDSRCQDRQLVGGKAATLAKLCTVMPELIPPGLALPSAAALQVVTHSSDRAARESHRNLVRYLADIAAPSGVLFVVRSSAAEEDSETRSYAGQYSSTLGCRSIEDVISGIAATLKSGNSAQVAAYTRTAGTAHAECPAVLIQQMITADRSGVAFTRNPVTSEGQVIINASYGLGDALVEGSISPDELILDADLQVISRRVGSKHTMSLVTPSGLKRIPVPDSLKRVSALSDEQACAVADAATRCSDVLGYAVDIEWAISGESLYVVQARPITALRTAMRAKG